VGGIEIPEYAFYGCKALKTLTIPPSITTISNWAFGACESLKTVIIKSSKLEIGDGVFGECKNLSVIEMQQSTITSFGNGVFGGCQKLPQQQYADFHRQQQSNNRITTGVGPDLDFKGKTQKGWGPEWWGVSLEQIQALKKHPFYNRTGEDGKRNYLMREFVRSTIEPLTDGTQMGYALLMNKKKPLKARVMVSVSCYLTKSVSIH